MDEARQSVYNFGDFRLDARRRQLVHAVDDRPVELVPKAVDVLVYLIERAGELVEKQELLEAIWPGLFVEENTLTQAVSTLRRALGEGPRENRYIATVPGRGYRFVAELDRGQGTSPSADHSRRRYLAGRGLVLLVITALAAIIISALVRRGAETPQALSQATKITASELLTGAGGSHAQPDFSPDGSHTVFVSDVTGRPQLYVQNLGRGEARQLTDMTSGAGMPSWSGRNDQVVFQAGYDGIWSIDPMGTLAPRRLVAIGRNPDLSTDGGKIVFEDDRKVRLALADGSSLRTLDAIPTGVRTFAMAYPALSPDGRRVVYFQQSAGPLGDYWLVDLDGGTPRRLTYDMNWGDKPAWTPDGQHIVFPSKRGGTMTLWRVAVDGGEPEPLTAGLGMDLDPAVSPDGGRLLYTTTRVETSFVTTNTITGEETVIYSNRRGSWFPRVSPKGEHLVFFAEFEPREQIVVMRIDGTEVEQLTSYRADQANIMPRWSQDGTSIIYYQEFPPASLRRLNLDGGPSETLISEFSWGLAMDAEYSPAGDQLAYIRIDPATRQRRAVIRSLSDSREIELDPAITYAPQWSGDGQHLLGTNREQVVICPVDANPCEVIVDATTDPGGLGSFDGESGPAARFSWDRSRIFYFRHAPVPDMMSLWTVSLDGSDHRHLFDYGPVYELNRRFEVLPDNRILWVRYVKGEAELVLATLSRNASERADPIPADAP